MWVLMPGRHDPLYNCLFNGRGPRPNLFVGDQRHGRDVIGVMTGGAILVENRRDVFGERYRRTSSWILRAADSAAQSE